MRRLTRIDRGPTVLAFLFLFPLATWAQQAPAGIAGVVRDTSGAVMPGVTVEAASPVLIEQVRVVVTDGQGRYNIVDLRPGTYVVSFTLPGFSVIRREGIELTAGFTASVNVELQVGGLEETITVTGAAPLVDTQNVRQQLAVTSDILETLPTGQANLLTMVALTPGLSGDADVGGSRGTWFGMSQNNVSFHGRRQGAAVQYDGMRIQNFSGGGSPGYMFNVHTVQEMVVQTGAGGADSASTSMTMNMVPKEGGNSYAFEGSGLFSNQDMQGSNLTDELRARGLDTSPKIIDIWDAGVTAGGPIRRDRLWFFGSLRRWGGRNEIPGLYWNATQGTPFYTPDLGRPASNYEWNRSHALRLTGQVTRRNKANFYIDLQHNCQCMGRSYTNAPETFAGDDIWPTGIIQGTWHTTLTNRLLFEAGGAAVLFSFPQFPQPGVERHHISILEQSTNFRYGAPAFGLRGDKTLGDIRNVVHRYVQRASVAYVTGTNALKIGFQIDQGDLEFNRVEGFGPDGVSHIYNQGVPVGLTQYAFPHKERAIHKADMGIYVQNQTTLNRLTLNYGLRFDYVNGYVPAISLPAGPFVPAREFAAVHKVPEWKDLNPRMGAAYDLFGNGRTAVKVALGRYMDLTGGSFTNDNGPTVTSVNQTNRSWTDANRNHVPDCDLTNFGANGECGPIANANFGKVNPLATRYAEDVLRGWGKRFYTWELSTELQHELRPGLSLTTGYYRNWSGNFRVTENVAVSPADYDSYCVTAPTDPRLPGGGGQQICGLFDIKPERFGQVSNVVTQASNYGDQTARNDFFNFSVNTRFGPGVRLAGGVDTGRSIADDCFAVAYPNLTTQLAISTGSSNRTANQRIHCRVVTPFGANTQIKLNGSLPLPADFVVSGTYRNQAGPSYQADYAVPTAAIAPSLGRPLAGGVRTATVPLIEPETQFEGRDSQLDLRLSRIFRVKSARLQVNLDAYNVTNSSAILGVRSAYGSRWREVTDVLAARLFQVSGRFSF